MLLDEKCPIETRVCACLCIGLIVQLPLSRLRISYYPPCIDSDFACHSSSLFSKVPPSLYALSRGGVQSSATIADVFDIGGFSLLALFNGYVAGLVHPQQRAAWIPTFQITTACSVASLISLTLAILRQ